MGHDAGGNPFEQTHANSRAIPDQPPAACHLGRTIWQSQHVWAPASALLHHERLYLQLDAASEQVNFSSTRCEVDSKSRQTLEKL